MTNHGQTIRSDEEFVFDLSSVLEGMKSRKRKRTTTQRPIKEDDVDSISSEFARSYVNLPPEER